MRGELQFEGKWSVDYKKPNQDWGFADPCQRGRIFPGVRLPSGPFKDQCGAGGAGIHEPGTDCEAGGVLGSQYSSCGAFYGLGGGFHQGRYGGQPAVPSAGVPGDRGEIIQFPVAHGCGMDGVRPGGNFARRCGRGQPGEDGGPGNFRLCADYGQYAGFLAGIGAANGVCGVAEGAAHRAFRAHRRGGLGGDAGRPDCARHFTGADFVHHRDFQHCHAHP